MNKETRYTILFWFFLANFFITLFIASSYLDHAPSSPSIIEWIFSRTAFVSNFALLYLLLGFVLFIFSLILPSIMFFQLISGFVLSLFNIILLVDTIIFKLYKFHINSLVWNILTTEGSSDSVILGKSTLTTFGLFILFILLLEIGIHVFIAKQSSKRWFNKNNLFRFSCFAVFCFAINLIDKGTYAYADLTNKTYITRYDKLFPLYQPLTIKRLAKYYWGYDVNQENEFKDSKSNGILNYPLSELVFKEGGDKPNIVLIVIDSWRFDMMNPEVSPKIHSFSKNALVFNDHYSGGNSTRFGIFSLFYGIYGTYWHTILSERREPVFMKTIREMDYEIGVWSSTQLTFPEFRKTAFIGIPDKIHDQLNGDEAKERDLQHPELFDNWLSMLNDKKPFFAFLFLDAPHEQYSYPDNFIRFKPIVNEINYMDLDKNSNLTPFINHYKNAVYFDDYITGQLIDILKNRQLMDDTILIITGDHGAEFYERGFWGHNSSFSPEQIKVPLIMHLPGESAKQYNHRTSHYDIVPTLFERMGSITPFDQYSIGESIFSLENQPRNYIVASSWGESAIINKEATLVFSTESHNIGVFEIRDSNYSLIADRRYTTAFKASEVANLMLEMGKFLK